MFFEVISIIFKIVFFGAVLVIVYNQFDRTRQYNKRQKRRNESQERRNKPKIKVDYHSYEKSNVGYCVYEISFGGMTYYGVTHNFEARRTSHLLNMKNQTHDNYLLQKQYDAGYIDENSFSIYTDNLTSAEAYNMEFELRPRPNMGWNLSAGGK